ncbi:MAG: EFR1 family ferrodoxin [Treponema sp.]|nr:EFR1 family ferrodoxin [Treponema sp.]
MIIFYFSGTGNSKYIAELFCQIMEVGGYTNTKCFSIEENIDFESLIDTEETIGFCYPIFFSRAPKIMREFVTRHMEKLKNKKLIIFCTQMILSGDGARALTYIFPKKDRRFLNVIYTEHFFMPNNVTDLLILPVESGKSLRKYIVKSEKKMQKVCRNIKNGKIKKRGFNVFSQLLGLLQAVFVKSMERKAHDWLKINGDCSLCGKCVSVCPTKNLVCENQKIIPKYNCTLCYRCINECPQKAITFIFNGKVKKQYKWSET